MTRNTRIWVERLGINSMETQQARSSTIPKEDLLLHPVRMRIILAAASRQEVTVQRLADDLPDIPQATLYRNIRILADAGILEVVREKRIRNTIERTYTLRRENLLISQDDLKNAHPEDYMRQFTEYLGILLGYFSRYLVWEEHIDLVRDHVAYTLIPLNLSENEADDLTKALQGVLAPFLNNEPSPDRERLLMGLLTMPDTSAATARKSSSGGN
jgi:DNA-binding transcriptional ArsR family regulator